MKIELTTTESEQSLHGCCALKLLSGVVVEQVQVEVLEPLEAFVVGVGSLYFAQSVDQEAQALVESLNRTLHAKHVERLDLGECRAVDQ